MVLPLAQRGWLCAVWSPDCSDDDGCGVFCVLGACQILPVLAVILTATLKRMGYYPCFTYRENEVQRCSSLSLLNGRAGIWSQVPLNPKPFFSPLDCTAQVGNIQDQSHVRTRCQVNSGKVSWWPTMCWMILRNLKTNKLLSLSSEKR